MMLHHPLPHSHRHPISALFVPRDPLHLQTSVRSGVENRSAEQKKKRHFSFPKCIKVLRGGHVQVVSAQNWQDSICHFGEWTHRYACMAPKPGAKRLPPTIWCAKKIDQPLFF